MPFAQTLGGWDAQPCAAEAEPVAETPPERAVTTHPAVVAACIRACVQRGVLPQNITVAHSPGGAWTPGGMRAIYAQSGMAAVCEETGAALTLAAKRVCAKHRASVCTRLS